MSDRTVIHTEQFDQMVDRQLIWYVENSDDPRILQRFINAIERSIDEIAHAPESLPLFMPQKKRSQFLEELGFRFKRIDPKFPHLIYFQHDKETITLRFFYHSKQNRDQRMTDLLEADDDFGQ